MKWELLHPDQEQAEDVPCRRAAFGGMLSDNGCVYLFGGIKVMYGRPKGPGDLSVQGSIERPVALRPGSRPVDAVGRPRWAHRVQTVRYQTVHPEAHDLAARERQALSFRRVLGAGPRQGGDQAERSLGLRSEDSLVGADRARRRARIRDNGGWASSRRVRRDGGGRSGRFPVSDGGTWRDDARPAVDLRGAGREMGVPGACIERSRRLAAETILSRACRLERQALPVGRSGQSGSSAGVLQRSVGIRSRQEAPGPAFRRTGRMMLRGLPLGTGWDTL